MAHDISQEQVRLGITEAQKRRVKDSLLLILVFLVGLIGSCYILHIALSQPSSSVGFQSSPASEHGESAEVIYVSGR
jgi:hypothetical protein